MPALKPDFDVAADFERILKLKDARLKSFVNHKTGMPTEKQWIWFSSEGIELSLIRKYKEGSVIRIQDVWFQDRIRHRQNGPSEITYDPVTGYKIEERWLSNADWINPSGGAAHIFYDKQSGLKTKEVWVHQNKVHRQGGPAVIQYHPETGRLLLERWACMGKTHRLEGPAEIYYDSRTGEKEAAVWCIDGYLHNPNGGPDTIRFRPL